ncbi:hypothetical protein ACFPT7_06725 [Acidicapsa dinghuensis]|uniref:Six-hairpin glycosidase-like protein n=1 Tax=Acidicapsa dinghuensis TaxID=2218256 RepID=A0ABW1ED70_9BACT|nr:hypothetical protein [Acidicapsa dinghuensis]
MRALVIVSLLVGMCGGAVAQGSGASVESAWKPQGILQAVENASVTATGDELRVVRTDADAPVKMVFAHCTGIGVEREADQWWVLPIGVLAGEEHAEIRANGALWVLPLDAESKDHSWYLKLDGGEVSATKSDAGLTVLVNADHATLREAEARPHSDPLGNRFSIAIAGGEGLEDALAGFYWGTMLPSVVEKTMAAHFKYSSGYVLSTLNVKSYAGSYPAVDHEFQIKGRLAMGSELDLDVVKRMIGLQFQLMKDDPEGLFRAPCSVQPDGRREYHVRRNSEDNRVNAAMFPVTGNIEVVEEAWRYYEARKDAAWLKENIGNLENAAGWTLAHVDRYGRLWSDVYYEDQVMKDGRVTQAQGFAARSFALMAKMERVAEREAKAAEYDGIAGKMAKVLVAPLPMGYWDERNQRFIDWVDRDGRVHDHIHLVANALPVLLGYATKEQAAAVRKLIEENAGQFERFPSFLSADIAGYTRSEIGSGGPYDLSAAGRYWYWDAAYRESQGEGAVLLDQLKKVAAEGAKNNYLMGERYDMDYVYYIDGKNAHGAERYYEYPNVFTAVLIGKWLGVTKAADVDAAVAPHITGYGDVELRQPEYALRYRYSSDGFVLRNLSDKTRRFAVDLSAFGGAHFRLIGKHGDTRGVITLGPQEEAHWVQ